MGLTGVALLLAALGAAGESPCVAVSIEPLAFFVERLAGPDACVTVLVGPGQSPHIYEPVPKQLAEASSAKIFLCAGMPFEQRVVGKVAAANPGLKVIDLTQGIKRRPMDEAEAVSDHADHDLEDRPGAPDPHVWLDPHNAKIIARNVADALIREDAPHAADYEKNLQTLLRELDSLDARLRQILGPHKGRSFYVYHPAFGYFADAYGLKQVSVEIGGKEPAARQLADFIDRAKRENVRVIFVQRSFPSRAAESVAKAMGGAVIKIDPLSRDYVENIEAVALKMQEAWQKADAQSGKSAP
ncbi:MAG TPA: zinc ABC transporter substrate-binding protein [Candidatus Bathyarchaeia archaeon]|nr:zinc ABC transporter substrate-binding protein [Candidatus Bathyarchaeia archaeon]